MGFTLLHQLPSAEEVRKEYPLSEKLTEIKAKRDEEIKAIFRGESKKFLLVIGPCSADHEDPVLEYCHRLKEVAKDVEDQIFIVPRIYTNKPRTTGEGYKGMLHQPDPEKRPNLTEGIYAIRKLHMKVLEETGFSTADEMLYPDNLTYLSDMMSYVAVGARSVENQQHRLVASGIDVPVGMKNPTSGDLGVMLNSIYAGQHGYEFIFREWEVKTLRIAHEVMHSRKYSTELAHFVKGLMVESYLLEGSAKVEEHILGKSITDPCIGWDDTLRLISNIYDYQSQTKY